MINEIVSLLPWVIAALAITVFFILAYVKAPPDMAYIISGLTREPRVLNGKGGFRIPFLERKDELYLGQMSVDIKTGTPVPTKDFINVDVDAVAKIRVGRTAEDIQIASKNFLNYEKDEIAQDLKDSLEGNMREIVGTLSLEAINTDRDSFSDQVMAKASVDMKKLGIEILSCNIQNVTDDKGLIEALGAENSAKIMKNASISKANAERDVAIASADAAKVSNDAKVQADLEIAQKQNELAIRRAELKVESDIKQAKADAAYDIQKQEQEKFIQEKTVEALIKKAEKDAELKAREVEIEKQKLEAEIARKADFAKYEAEKKAEADLVSRQKEAEANLYQQQREAEARKAEAEALKYSMEQEALGIKAKGDAEAYAIRLKGEAEALAMEKKAEAYQKYNKVAMAQMAIEILPKVASEVAKPLSSIDKVTIFGGSKDVDGISSISNNVPLVMAQTFKTLEEATGVDLKEILRSETFEAKTTKNINITGIPDNTDISNEVITSVITDDIEK